MKVISSIVEMQRSADELRSSGRKIGVVPTMGALHEGHLSLIRIARNYADVVIATIFVNPVQFGPNEDFNNYPRDLQGDSRLAESAGTDILFAPQPGEMYPDGYLTYITVERLTTTLEGKSRPTHFRGVTTIVAKLFNITKPAVAVFGQKDAQQVVVIRRMVSDLNMGVKIVAAPIVREPDGLAMSSRNAYLSPQERKQSLVLSQSLRLAEQLISRGERTSDRVHSEMMNLISSQPAARVDYISISDPVTLQEMSTLDSAHTVLISLAVWIGTTRLIDNLIITV
ncbi:MAG TPA: pantoate--beta-alanine ligase [Bacteroidota bacterium]|nr:pantoate--beta-alanine ligase [Bacteroidota bacterium]